jgi:chemotaxis protein MotB
MASGKTGALTSGPANAIMEPAAYETGRQSGNSSAWIITFTDLAALMLTFFVLQFSMSKVDEAKWQNLLDSFQLRLTTLQQDVAPSPMVLLDIVRPSLVPGRDLNYLSSVLEEQLRREGLDKVVDLRHRPDHLRLSLPVTVFAGLKGSNADGRPETLRAIAGLLVSLENDIEVIGYVQSQGRRRNRPLWTKALVKAVAAAKELAGAGFTRRIAVSGRAAPQGVEGSENRIDVIIYANVQQAAQ